MRRPVMARGRNDFAMASTSSEPDPATWVALLTQTTMQQHLLLRFAHRCQYMACCAMDCALCKNNVHKRCAEGEHFAACYVQSAELRARCGGSISMQLVNASSHWQAVKQQQQQLAGMRIQLSVVDGSPRRSSSGGSGSTGAALARELLRSDCQAAAAAAIAGPFLLGANMELCQNDGHGRILVDLQDDGACFLPGLHVTDKCDTFRVKGQTFSSFRLVARAVAPDARGALSPLPHIAPAVSSEFTVKSSRAVQEFLKPDYLHHREPVTRLKHVGSATAACLENIQQHIPEVPLGPVQTVEQLSQLVRFAEQHPHLYAKLQELLRSKGIQRHKFLFLRSFLADRVVHDDDERRVWFPDGPDNRGLLLVCRQGQVNMQEPLGFVEWATSSSGEPSLRALAATNASDLHALRSWAVQAQEDWARPGHPGWDVVSHLLAGRGRTPLPTTRAAAGTAGASAAVQHAPSHDHRPSCAASLVRCNTAPGGCTQHSHHHPGHAHPSDPWGLTYLTVSTPVGHQLQSATSVSSSPFEHTSLSALLPSSSEPMPNLHPSGPLPLPSHLAAMRAMREQKPGSWPRSAAAAANAAAIASSLSLPKSLLKVSGSGGGASPRRLASAHQALLTSDLVGLCPQQPQQQQQHYQPRQQHYQMQQQHQQEGGHTSPFSDMAVFELTGTSQGTGLRRLATAPTYAEAAFPTARRGSKSPPLGTRSSANHPPQSPPMAAAADCVAVTWPASSLSPPPPGHPASHAVRAAPASTFARSDFPLDAGLCPWPVPETVSTSTAVVGPAVEGTAAASGREHQRTPSEPAAEDLWQLLLDAMDTTPL